MRRKGLTAAYASRTRASCSTSSTKDMRMGSALFALFSRDIAVGLIVDYGCCGKTEI